VIIVYVFCVSFVAIRDRTLGKEDGNQRSSRIRTAPEAKNPRILVWRLESFLSALLSALSGVKFKFNGHPPALPLPTSAFGALTQALIRASFHKTLEKEIFERWGNRKMMMTGQWAAGGGEAHNWRHL